MMKKQEEEKGEERNKPKVGLAMIIQRDDGDGETEEELAMRVEEVKKQLKQKYMYVDELQGFNLSSEQV